MTTPVRKSTVSVTHPSREHSLMRGAPFPNPPHPAAEARHGTNHQNAVTAPSATKERLEERSGDAQVNTVTA
jgi:hypothetical protein